jgi:sialate O-acetylesterase
MYTRFILLAALLVSATASLHAEDLKKGDRIVFLGDSITQAGARGNGYIRQIEKAINAAHPDYGVAIIGAGISGHKVPDCQKRLQRDVIDKKPTIVFIYIGINDVWHWNRNRGTKKEDFDAGLRDMIAKINAAGARVIMCTPTVIGEKTDGSNKFDKMLDEYSDISRKVAKDTDSQMLDLRKGFMDHIKASNPDNKDRGILTGDSVHLNGAGNAKVAELMLGALGVTVPKLQLPTIFTSHMVLQRNKPLTVWGKADAGKNVSVALGDETVSATASAAGDWSVTLKARKASTTPVSMTVSSAGESRTIDDILVGDVWIGSGQSNMEWSLTRSQNKQEFIAAANHPHIRLYHVPKVQAKQPAADINAKWKTCVTANAPNFSAVLYHFGKRLHADLSVPMGLINSSWGGSPIEPWTVTEKGSGGMYNAMIAPLAKFPITGCIWYQGETNVIKKNGLSYYDKMNDLIVGWRKHWGDDMPFYFVHIAPWSGGKYEAGQLPALWEGQTKTLNLPHTGMAVVTDLVHNINDIHPSNKHDVGDRLARWALAKKYGKGGVYSGPLLKSVKVEGNKARVSFAHAAGLKSRDGKPLNEFKVAGADGKFVDATAEVDGETVVVSADGVTPVTVQFGWHKVANPNLVNGAGLPAAPFQSKDWQGGTGE